MTSKGQLLIPKRIRTKYGIESGVKIIFEETATGVIIRPMNGQFFKSFRGILKGDGNLKQEMKDMKADEKKIENQKLQLPFKSTKK